MSALIQVKNITKKYGSQTVLDNISFELERSKSLAIIGPSGSGKSTLLHIISGLDKPSSGNVFFNAKDIYKLSDDKLSRFRNETLGFVFQNMYLQEYLTVIENVMMPMSLAGGTGKDNRIRAEELLTQVGLKDKMKSLPKQLSGGEEQRVAIARALANNPSILMADEPTAKLDKENRDAILGIFDDISQNGTSIIVITHDEYYKSLFKNSVNLNFGKFENFIN